MIVTYVVRKFFEAAPVQHRRKEIMGYKVVDKTKGWHGVTVEKVYAFGTGRINIQKSGSIRAARFLRRQRGLKTWAGNEKGCLWFFGTMEEAVAGRKQAKSKGIKCSEQIKIFEVNEKNELNFIKDM